MKRSLSQKLLEYVETSVELIRALIRAKKVHESKQISDSCCQVLRS